MYSIIWPRGNVSVNSILGLPQLKAWKAYVLLRSSWMQAHDLGLTFPLEYQAAEAGLPQGVSFSPEQYVQPLTQSDIMGPARANQLNS